MKVFEFIIPLPNEHETFQVFQVVTNEGLKFKFCPLRLIKRYCRHVCVKDFLVKKGNASSFSKPKKKKGNASIAQLLVTNCLC